MQLDLRLLKAMHPRLPATTASEYGHRGSIALQRHHKEGNCDLHVSFSDGMAAGVAQLSWERVPPGDGFQLDKIRVTEDGAEAVALALVSVARGWRVLRRMQRGESADWLLEGGPTNDRPVAFEVSGIDGGPNPRRLEEKVRQVRMATECPVRCACVVAFEPPAAALGWG